MKWTTEKPTIDGYYWVLDEGEVDLVELTWYAGRQRLTLFEPWNKNEIELSAYTYFMGPLPVPIPPEETV